MTATEPPKGAIEDFIARVYTRLASDSETGTRTPWTKASAHGIARLAAHLTAHYGVDISPAPHELDSGVFRVPQRDGSVWVARVFPAARPQSVVEGDARILEFLRQQGFPAERCAHAEPVTMLGDEPVLVTEFVEGAARHADASDMRRLGDLLGRLHTLPAQSAPMSRPAGGWHGLSVAGGSRRDDVRALLPLLADAERHAPADQRTHFDTLRAALDRIDYCEDLPHALIHVDMGGPNVLWSAAGEPTVIDWAGAGTGPRVHSLTALMGGFGNPELVDAFVAGYRGHVVLEPDELARLAAALRIHSLVLECWMAVFVPQRLPRIVAGLAAEVAATQAVATRVRDGFRH